MPDVGPRERKPRSKARRLASDQRVDGGRRGPSPPAYFVWGWYGLAVPLPDEEVKVFPFDETVSDIERVLNRPDAVQLAVEAHFFSQATLGRLRDLLAGSRMPAAGVRPEPARVILRRRPLLQQQFVAVVDDEHRECAVSPSVNVRRQFRGHANAPIASIHQDDQLSSWLDRAHTSLG